MLDGACQAVNITGQEAPDGAGPGATCAAEEDGAEEREGGWWVGPGTRSGVGGPGRSGRAVPRDLGLGGAGPSSGAPLDLVPESRGALLWCRLLNHESGPGSPGQTWERLSPTHFLLLGSAPGNRHQGHLEGPVPRGRPSCREPTDRQGPPVRGSLDSALEGGADQVPRRSGLSVLVSVQSGRHRPFLGAFGLLRHGRLELRGDLHARL